MKSSSSICISLFMVTSFFCRGDLLAASSTRGACPCPKLEIDDSMVKGRITLYPPTNETTDASCVNGRSCAYTLAVNKTCRVSITFSSLNLTKGDNISVYEQDQSRLLIRVTKENNPVQLVTFGNQASLVFASNGKSNASGFDVSYEAQCLTVDYSWVIMVLFVLLQVSLFSLCCLGACRDTKQATNGHGQKMIYDKDNQEKIEAAPKG